MKKLLYLFLILLASCSGRSHTERPSEYTEIYYSPKYSESFQIRTNPNDSGRKLLEVYRPDTMSIVIPSGGFKSIVCLSSTYIGFLAEAEASERITGVSRIDLVTNPLVKTEAVEVGYDGAFDYEAILSANPDLILIYGINGPNVIADKLSELNIDYVYIHDFEEQHPLGRAEWLIALGALVDKDMRAKFSNIAAAYKPDGGDSSIMLNAPYGGAWFIPGTDNYMSRLINDAGGRINAPQPAGEKSQPIDMEVAIPALNSADVWLNPGQAATIIQAERLAPHADFHGPIWNQRPDFYESGAVRPDLVLEELKRIFHHDETKPFHYFKKLQ